jgi:signal transduction histidine kinase
MTRGLAHEIKNPLSTISLNAQLLGERVEDAPTDRALSADERAALRKRVESLRREVERLRGILTDFLTYAGELRVEVSPQDVASIVRDLADFFAPQAQHAGVRLRVEAQPQLPKAMCDSPHLKQALLNLLLNAQQAMLSNGPEAKRELIVRAVLRQPEKAQSRQVPRDQQIVIEVIDTGPGIAPDVLSKIFDPYFTTKAGGSGLGLPTSRRIIEAMGGRLEVESEVGRGTLMRVVLAGA